MRMLLLVMVRTSRKRKLCRLNLQKARSAKRRCISVDKAGSSNDVGSSMHHNTSVEKREPEDMTDLLNLSHDAADTDNEEADTSFDFDTSIKSDQGHAIESFCEDWATSL